MTAAIIYSNHRNIINATGNNSKHKSRQDNFLDSGTYSECELSQHLGKVLDYAMVVNVCDTEC